LQCYKIYSIIRGALLFVLSFLGDMFVKKRYSLHDITYSTLALSYFSCHNC
jgi:hypothetical protein